MGGKAGTRTARGVKERAAQVVALLNEHYPDAAISLRFETPVELMVATILSAQCTDVRVNEVTEALFRKYRTVADYAAAETETFMEEIRPTGFFRNKAKNIIAAAGQIMLRHGGEVPARLDDLVALPGIGRKTANVILGNAFAIPGVVVDTHVKRVTGRLGLTRNTDPVKIEFDLMKIFPRERWTLLAHQIIAHGRLACRAPRPRCGECFFDETLCPARRSFL